MIFSLTWTQVHSYYHSSMGNVPIKNKKRQREGFSLVLIMIILFSFLAAYPLITRYVNDGQRFAESFERWTQLQVARDSALQILASGTTPISKTLQATYSYTIGASSSFSISLIASITSTSINASATAVSSTTAYVEHPDNLWNAGFDVANIVATFSHPIASMTAIEYASPSEYLFWDQTL